MSVLLLGRVDSFSYRRERITSKLYRGWFCSFSVYRWGETFATFVHLFCQCCSFVERIVKIPIAGFNQLVAMPFEPLCIVKQFCQFSHFPYCQVNRYVSAFPLLFHSTAPLPEIVLFFDSAFRISSAFAVMICSVKACILGHNSLKS